MEKETVQSLIGLFGEIKEQKEVFHQIAANIVEVFLDFSGEASILFDAVRAGLVKARIKSVAEYEAAGFSRIDAIVMTLDDFTELRRGCEKIGKK